MTSGTIEKPLVSIITVCYNLVSGGRVPHFKQCITSVLEQTYTNIEHIVIDGGSQDGTVELLKSIIEQTEKTKPGTLRYISEPDNGIYDAMNKGINVAKGKYIAFLNSDDFWHETNGVELSVAALESSNAAFSYAPRTVVSESGDFMYKENSAIGIFAECMLSKGYMDDELIQHIIRKVHPVIALDVLRCHKWDAAGVFSLSYGLTQIDAKGRYKAGFEMNMTSQWKLFSILPILSLKQRKNRTECFLLGFIPIGRIRRKFNKKTFLLFGFIPIFSCSKDL